MGKPLAAAAAAAKGSKNMKSGTNGPCTTRAASGRPIEGCERITVPAPRASGNLLEDNRRLQFHRSLVDIVQWCLDNPDKVLSVQSLMRTDLIAKSSLGEAPKGEGLSLLPFHATYQFLGRIPKYYIVWYLMTELDNIFSPERLASIDKYDKDNVRRIFHLMHATTDQMRWPCEAKDKEVLTQLLRARALLVGARIHPKWAECISGDGSIDWSNGGAFALRTSKQSKDEAGPRVEIKHVSGVVAYLPERTKLTPSELKGVEISDPVSDKSASLDIGGFVLKLHTRFAKDVGPNLSVIGADANNSFKDAAAAMSESLRTGRSERTLNEEDLAKETETAQAIVAANEHCRKQEAAAKRKAKPTGPGMKRMRVSVG